MNELLTQWKENQEAINELLAAQKELEAQIKPFVLENKATLNAEGVTASYKKGRASCDYAGAANAAGVDSKIVADHTKVKYTTSWAKVCKDAGIIGDALEPYKIVGDPSVSIKLV